ncbi:SIS domain-containing protein [Rhodoferax sp. GW822-FHT02A01]|uniref:SIS domain-containing protein n=1 Tax=Rhodoferax sp. GW822-FHT02A01 TaxID=3141537 RepID=UPI00315DF8D4
MTTKMYQEACASAAQVALQLSLDTDRYEALGAALRGSAPTGIVTIARGSSDHAASYFSYLVMSRTGQLVTSLPMSLMTLYRAPIAHQRMLAVSVSQSGRSPDLYGPMQMFTDAGATTVALVNAAQSPLADAVQWPLALHAGPEESVAATKSYICSLVAAARLAAVWGGYLDLIAGLRNISSALATACSLDWSCALPALRDADRLLVIGRGPGLAIANEAALKFKETCGIQAEAFSGAEVQHGPMALVDTGYIILIFALRGPAQASLLQVARDMRQRGANVLLAAPDDVAERDLTLATADIPDLDPIVAIQSFYLLVEAVSRARGIDPDAPRHLSKITSTL